MGMSTEVKLLANSLIGKRLPNKVWDSETNAFLAEHGATESLSSDSRICTVNETVLPELALILKENSNADQRHWLAVWMLKRWTCFPLHKVVGLIDRTDCLQDVSLDTNMLLYLLNSLELEDVFVESLFLLPSDFIDGLVACLFSSWQHGAKDAEGVMLGVVRYIFTIFVPELIYQSCCFKERNKPGDGMFEIGAVKILETGLLICNFLLSSRHRKSVFFSLLSGCELLFEFFVSLWDGQGKVWGAYMFRRLRESFLSHTVLEDIIGLSSLAMQMTVGKYDDQPVPPPVLSIHFVKNKILLQLLVQISKLLVEFLRTSEEINPDQFEFNRHRWTCNLCVLMEEQKKNNQLTDLKNIMKEISSKLFSPEKLASINEHCFQNSGLDRPESICRSDDLLGMEDALQSWQRMEDRLDKFDWAIHRVNNLLGGYEKCLEWLLNLHDILDSSSWCKCITLYGTTFADSEFIRFCCEQVCNKRSTNATLYKQILNDILPRISVKLADILLETLSDLFSYDSPFLWTSSSDRLSYFADLNLVLNKMTSSTFSCVKQGAPAMVKFCLASPYHFMEELLNRVFDEHLSKELFLQILCAFPHLLHMPNCISSSSATTSLVSFMYVAYGMRKQRTMKKNLLISLIMELGKLLEINIANSQLVFADLLDVFVRPTLEGSSEPGEDERIALSILSVIARKCSCYLSCKQVVRIQRNLLLRIEKYEWVAALSASPILSECFELAHRNIQMLAEELCLCLNTLAATEYESAVSLIWIFIGELDWSNQFLFFPLQKENMLGHRFSVPSALLRLCDLNLIDGTWKEWSGGSYSEHACGSWIALLELSIASPEASAVFITNMSVLTAAVMPDIIQAVASLLSSWPNRFKVDRMSDCLLLIYRKAKIQGLAQCFGEEVLRFPESHSTCFAFLIFVQSFALLLSQGENAGLLVQDAGLRTQVFVELFGSYVNAVKSTEEKARVHLLTFIFEQLIYSCTILPDSVVTLLQMLLLDILSSVLDLIRQRPKENKISRKLEQLIGMDSRDSLKALSAMYLKYRGREAK